MWTKIFNLNPSNFILTEYKLVVNCQTSFEVILSIKDHSFLKFWTTMVKNCPKMTVIRLSEGEKSQYWVLWAEYWIWNPVTSYWLNISCYLTVKLHSSCYRQLISHILWHNGGKLSQYYCNWALRWWKMAISDCLNRIFDFKPSKFLFTEYEYVFNG